MCHVFRRKVNTMKILILTKLIYEFNAVSFRRQVFGAGILEIGLK